MRNIILLFTGLFLFNSMSFSQADKLAMALEMIESRYVDSVDSNALTEDAIRNMLKKLDPHSTYLNAKQSKSANQALLGNFVGIGVLCSIYRDSVVVMRMNAKGSAEKSGLEVGDRLIEVDGVIIDSVNENMNRVTDLLQGKENSFVDVAVVRDGERVEVKNIKRVSIEKPSVEAAYLLNDHTGYIYIRTFSRNSPKEFLYALNKMKKEGMTQLIIDLKGNGGGLMKSAVSIANELLPKNKLIVSTKGFRSPEKKITTVKDGSFIEGKLCLLIDEHSASASEILAGAIQDWMRGTVIGRRSFGKGLVQNPLYFSDKSQIRLTTARYYTPLGKSIQKPYKDYASDMKHRKEHGELVNKDSVNNDGGIMPDIFVPLDTSKFTEKYNDAVKDRSIVELSNEYFLKHNKELRQSMTVESWIESEPLNPESQTSLRMKATIAYYLWGVEAFHKVWNSDSKEIEVALNQMN